MFITLLISSGLGFYNASVILEAAKVELGASVAAVSGATTVFFAVGGVAGFAASPFIDRIDVRWFYLIGGIVGAAALASLRWVDSTIELYVFFAVFGVGFSLAGLVPGTTVVARAGSIFAALLRSRSPPRVCRLVASQSPHSRLG